MTANISQVVETIREILQRGELPGSRLASELRGRIPDWDPTAFGSRGLRDFVATHATDLEVKRNAGLDVVYGFRGIDQVTPAPTRGASAPDDLWRIWVSPLSHYSLSINPTHGTVRAVAKSDAKAEPEVRIDAPDVDAHRAIARQFLSQIGASEQAPFLAALEQHSEHWWQAWLAALRRTTHLKTWQHFRQQALQRTLSEALDRQSFSAEIKSRILEQVQRTRPAGSTWKLDRAPTLAFEALDDQRTRQLALAVIGRMSGAEIRELRLPLGRVIDALANSFH